MCMSNNYTIILACTNDLNKYENSFDMFAQTTYKKKSERVWHIQILKKKKTKMLNTKNAISNAQTDVL